MDNQDVSPKVYIRGLTNSNFTRSDTALNRLSGAFRDLDFTVLNPDLVVEETSDDDTDRDIPQIAKKDNDLDDNNRDSLPKIQYVNLDYMKKNESVPLRRTPAGRSMPNMLNEPPKQNGFNRLSVISNTSPTSEVPVFIKGLSRENVFFDRSLSLITEENLRERVDVKQLEIKEDLPKSSHDDNESGMSCCLKLSNYWAPKRKCKHKLLPNKHNNNGCLSVIHLINTLISSLFFIFKIGILSLLQREWNMSYLSSVFLIVPFECSKSVYLVVYGLLWQKMSKFTPALRCAISAIGLALAAILCSSTVFIADYSPDHTNTPTSGNIFNNFIFSTENSDTTQETYISEEFNMSTPTISYHATSSEFFSESDISYTRSFKQSRPNEQTPCTLKNVEGVYAVFIISSILHGLADAIARSTQPADIQQTLDYRNMEFYSGYLTFGHQLAILPAYLLSALVLWTQDEYNLRILGIFQVWWLATVCMVVPMIITACVAVVLHFRPRPKKKVFSVCADPQGHGEQSSSACSVLNLLKSKSFMCLALAGLFDTFIWGGYMVFISQYIRTLFQHDMWFTHLLLAVSFGVPAFIGVIVGGVMLSYFLKSLRNTVAAMLVTCFLTACLLVAMIWIRCDVNPQMNGTLPGCNDNCSLSSSTYFPVCGSNKITYFSPCFAGCSEMGDISEGYKNFTECVCIGDLENWAMEGECEFSCDLFYPYIVVMATVVFLAGTRVVPLGSSIIRVMSDITNVNKITGLSLYISISSLLGIGINTVIYGILLDMTCSVWHDELKINKICWIYDRDKYSIIFHSVTGACHLIASVCLCCCYFSKFSATCRMKRIWRTK